jgi:hypothetical protein
MSATSPSTKRNAVGHGPAEAGRQIVEHHHRPAGIEQREHGMAADIAGAAGDQDGEGLGVCRHEAPRKICANPMPQSIRSVTPADRATIAFSIRRLKSGAAIG